MKSKPKKNGRRTALLEVRLTETEKATFQKSAEFAGLPLSYWARERLRRASVQELEDAGIEIPFLHNIK